MPSLAESVMGAAQQGVEQQGHTVGDAMSAYHIAATAEHARQSLELQKQDADLNKAKWFSSSLDALYRMPESEMKKAALESFGQQARMVYPNINTDFTKAMSKDPEMMRKANIAAQMFANNKDFNPSDLQAYVSQASPELLKALEKSAEEHGKITSAQLGMAQTRMQMLEETKRQHALSFQEKATNDKIIGMSRTNLNSLYRSENILNDPKLPVTAKDLALAYNDYINAVAAGGAATEGKIARELPDTSVQQINELVQKYAGKNVDLRKTTAGAALINQLGARITGVKGDINDAIESQALLYHDMGVKSGNPYVSDAAKQILLSHAPNAYTRIYGKQAGNSAPPPPKNPYGETTKDIEANYAKFLADKAHKEAMAATQQQAPPPGISAGE